MTFTFVLSDESLNTHGFVVKTDGIDYKDFMNNPVMFYNHNRDGGVIGRWENVHVDGVRLIGDAVFDENDELGAKIKEKVEKGFINACSIGITVEQMETINGVLTAVKSRLVEVSICDIPSNPKAVKTDEKGVKTLYLSYPQMSLKERLTKCLNLNANATDFEIYSSIEKLNNTENHIENALKIGLIDESQKKLLLLSKNDRNSVNNYLSMCKTTAEEKINLLISDSIMNGKCYVKDKALLTQIGNELGYNKLKMVLELIPKRVSLKDTISQENGKRKGWTLDDYRKNAPEELKKDPGLYERLVRGL